MNKTTSIYLDLLRFSSAMLVFTFHARYSRFDGAWLNNIGAFGHDAVMIFFVLSGFVIAYATNKETGVMAYFKSRFARLYSVVVPALLLTLILDSVGKGLNPAMYIGGHYQDSQPIFRVLANLFFVNEIWFQSWRAFSNGPFWSLSYEFWYYVIFASWFFFSGWKRWLLTAVSALVAGPKILILFPIWLMGVAAFRLSVKKELNKYLSCFLLLAPLVVYFLIREYGVQKILLAQTVEVLGRDFVYHGLSWSRRFISDYIVGVLVATHIVGFVALSKKISFFPIFERSIRYLAGMTFAIYLLHYPFLQFYGSFVKEGVAIFTLTFFSVAILAPFTEGKKREWAIFLENVSRLVIGYSRAVLRAGRR